MKLSYGLLKADMLRLARGKMLYISIALIFALMWLGIWDDFKMNSEGDATYFYGLAHLTLFYQITFPASAALCAIYFCDDWNTKAFWLYSGRCGVKSYCYSTCAAAMISGGLAVVAGEMLFLLSLIPRYKGFFLPDEIHLAPYVLREIAHNGNVLAYYALNLLAAFMRNTLLSMVALSVSTFIPNRFVTICSPLITWMLLSFFSAALDLPTTVNILYVYTGRCNIQSAGTWIFYVVILTVALCTLLVHLCSWSMCRRIEK